MKTSKKLFPVISIAVFVVVFAVTAILLLIIKPGATPENTEENTSQEEIPEEKPKEPRTYTLTFTGDISLADNWHIAPKYDERGGISGILGDTMLETMKNSDFLAVNSEFTVSNRGEPLKGKMYTFRAKPERLNIYHEMGVDLADLANNHVYDYGKDAFLDMLDAFEGYQVPHIGAGKNKEEATKAYFTTIGDFKFAFVACTRAEKNVMTPQATETNPGTFWCYDPTEMINLIASLKDQVDFVIPIVHFGREIPTI